MRTFHQRFAVILLGAISVSPLFMGGCAVHARVYDPYYHDYHTWNGETVYYNQWERDNHRDHEDFNKRSDADKKAYWDWRHNQGQH
jgi:hypothetical protein